MKLLSVVVVCYNEEETLRLFYNEIIKVSKEMSKLVNFEFIFVNDGSKDKSLDIMRSLHKKDKRVRYISFSRNFGKEAAMYAGLVNSKGDYVTLMDADLQDPPSMLSEMFSYITEEGYDSVATRRVTRKGEPVIRSFFARGFYKLINSMSNVEMVDGARDYRLMTRQMVDSIIDISEYNRYSKGIFSFVGYNTKWLEFENVERVAGETKWSFFKLFKYAIEGIISFTTTPLYLSSILGIFVCLISFIFIGIIVVRAILYGDPVSGWPSTMSVILFLGGLQLFCMGIIGQYLAKTYLEVKKRPIYIVKETEND